MLMEQKKHPGHSYLMRVTEVNEIYKTYQNSGLSNREILRRHIWPIYFICENTFYRYLTVPYKRLLKEKGIEG